jgi:hypothetical protein
MDPNNDSSRKLKQIAGAYANDFKVGHNAYEFILDFGQCYSDNEEAEPCARIVTSPYYAKMFLATLIESIEQYEKKFGRIQSA